MRAAIALCACDGSGLAAAVAPFEGSDRLLRAAAVAPFEGSDRLLRRVSGSTLLPFGTLLRCSKPVSDAGGIGATLPLFGWLGLVLAIRSDTQARRALRPDSCMCGGCFTAVSLQSAQQTRLRQHGGRHAP